ncbi:SOS mutagenesis and repair protein UmuC [Pedobacter yonginense]|uniref:SOS mutagenesis and repair protein UmuC n=1 Tax=Pedobacter yonginense TaxID=651869 RepID=A0A317ERX6_9SPHI|nr:Y-family DNA polymerase [Pedobacter yonginense]PWS29444.1 SOS mutagenesis and repair protein UmuC [Pedobacter yonginense]
MFALADCNNFYASCHRLFEPQYNGLPVVVLSNNDGCVIARSNEAKACGIAMGAPFFKIKSEIEKHKIAVFSSHYTLYGDISARVMTNLARFTPDVEVYSIDECFLGLSGFDNLYEYGKEIRETVIKNTGIPISVGIAPTKVLAKVANKTSKKHNGVMVLQTEAQIANALSDYPVEDLWGVGRQFAHKLIKGGIETAAQFRALPMDWVQSNMTIVGLRMWRELWGESCIPLKTVLDPKKGMCTSRAFGKLTTDYNQLKEATSSYAARLGVKLRREKLCASVISVRLLTNKFGPEALQAYPAITIPLAHPVNNTVNLVNTALFGLKKIYLRGYLFQKVEVTATGLLPETEVQLNIFTAFKGVKHDQVSKVLDRLNLHYGSGTLRMAGEGKAQEWTMKREFLRPSYTTNWNDIIKVK